MNNTNIDKFKTLYKHKTQFVSTISAKLIIINLDFKT